MRVAVNNWKDTVAVLATTFLLRPNESTCRLPFTLQEIANLLEMHGIKRVPVIENGRLVGIVSRANLVQALATRGLAFVDVAEADEALWKVIVLNLRKLPWTAAMTMGRRDRRPRRR
jgi:CBS domain-containing protein